VRFLILSDIHANWEALDAVLKQARGEYDRILCCGDVVGYGADPDRVTEWVRDHCDLVIRGNHDKVCAGLDDLEWFSPLARASAVWTREHIKPGNISYLHELPAGPARVDGFQILHGSPADEDEYLVTDQDAAQVFPYLDMQVSFFGHTHLQGGFQLHRNGVRRLPPIREEVVEHELDPDGYYLLNPGSVGQPRDGDWRAAYAIWEPTRRVVRFHRVEYRVEATQRKILAAGLPNLLASRLELGA
jgi:predicted phosphodiesterase